ncbi:MAG: hypothetical protein ABSH32_22300 [Bryobacteraceae bacterium]|jgi:hypothetical protein
MATNAGPPSVRVQNSFRQLAAAAANLNSVSDELGKSIEELDTDLKKLNLGISAWVTIFEDQAEGGEHWYTEQIGYTKINNKWGIALRTCSGDYSYPPADTSTA